METIYFNLIKINLINSFIDKFFLFALNFKNLVLR